MDGWRSRGCMGEHVASDATKQGTILIGERARRGNMLIRENEPECDGMRQDATHFRIASRLRNTNIPRGAEDHGNVAKCREMARSDAIHLRSAKTKPMAHSGARAYLPKPTALPWGNSPKIVTS